MVNQNNARVRTTRGQGRPINYMKDKAIQPPDPPECDECGGRRIREPLVRGERVRRVVCTNCGKMS